MNVAIGARTDTRRIREINEDSYLVHEPLFVVADGMGGHNAGDVTSQTAVKAIEERSASASAEDAQSLVEIVRGANSEIWAKATSDPALSGMGTTCTLLLLDDHRAHIAHVGDSRAYRFHDGTLERITTDHSLVGRMVEEGRLTADEAEHHPQRNIVTRALGVDSDVEVDLLTVDLTEGDRVLLCSDGLSAMTDRARIEEILRSEPDAQAAADKLVEVANDSGGEDNITVILVDIDGGGSGTGDAPGRAAEITAPPSPSSETGGHEGQPSQGAASSPQMTAVREAPLEPQMTSAIRAPTPSTEPYEEPARRTWPKKLAVLLIILLLLAGGAFGATRYVLANSWFVGVNDEGNVTIFKGIPEEIAGLTLSRQEEVTDLAAADLPQSLEANVSEGIKVDSAEEAQQRVSDLQDRADELDRSRPRNNRPRDDQG